MLKVFSLMVLCIGWMHARVHPYPYYTPSKQQLFGEITTHKIGEQHETKWGIPLTTREAIFSFPSELNTDSPYDYFYFIRGVLHVTNDNDNDCVPPQLDIIEGGIYEKNVTLKVTSQSGCGIDSLVTFYGYKTGRY